MNKTLLHIAFLCFRCFILVSPQFVYAQGQTFTGTVKNKANEALPNAHVKLVDEKGSIIHYGITNSKGEFFINIIPPKPDVPLWLEVTYIGYKNQKTKLIDKVWEYDFFLEHEAFTLPEIEVKSKPQIHSLGDTLRYDVASFTQQEDRSIGDVLRRMPGLEVSADGTIYFNGKKIENLYIHGDNLMDGRYAELPKMIRKEMIESVDVIKNFQPIKVLRNKVLSDKVAVNLVLKDENKLKATYKTMAAGGLPGLYDAAFTPILLNKNLKLINSVMANNAGTDYHNTLSQLGAANLLDNMNQQPETIDLSLATVGPPSLPRQTWYTNKSALANFNNLINGRNGLQFRLNLQGFTDNNILNYFNTEEYYVKNDTITYNEQQEIHSKPKKLISSANLMINKEQYYFNNNFRINLSKSVENGLINLNSAPFTESLTKNIRDFSNDVSWIPDIKGKNILTFRWLVNYNNNEQQLLINDGLKYDISGKEAYYDTIVQKTASPTTYSNAYVAYTIPAKKLIQEYKLGYATQIQQFNSDLFFKQKDFFEPITIDAGNSLEWNKENLYLSNKYSYSTRNLKSVVQLPISFQHIHYKQPEYEENTVKQKLIFSPSIDLRYDISQKHKLQFNYNYSNPFSHIKSIYKGAILMNYRLIHSNNAELQESKIHSLALNYGMENPVSMLFLNSGLTYHKINSNSILANEISANSVKTILLPYDNSHETVQLHLGTSKYLYALRSSIAVKAMIGLNKYGQLVNQELLSFQNKNAFLQATINKKLFQTVSLNYNPSLSWHFNSLNETNKAIDHLNYRAHNFEQNLSLGTTIFKRLLAELNANHSYTIVSGNDAVKYVFMDFKLCYSTKKSGIDLSFEVVNLFNVKDHSVFTNTFNQLSMSNYSLRGRMAILRIEYLF